MDAETRGFIENSTLLFIASRSAGGAMDVSPRGGQPAVLKVTEHGDLLLPDYNGNRRLDTISNVLGNRRVALIVLNRGSSRFLRINAEADVSFQAKHLQRFPADANPPISVLVLKPDRLEFVDSQAFDKAEFWLDPVRRLPPLDLSALIDGDKAAHAARGFLPVVREPKEELNLKLAGIRDRYGPAIEGVDQKIAGFAGPSSQRFMEKALFTVYAFEDKDGEIAIDIAAESPLLPIPFDNRHSYRLRLPVGAGRREGGCALLTILPGQNELLRINGGLELEGEAIKVVPREVFFHCSAALSRSRVWQQDRRSYWSGKRRFVCTQRDRESPEVTSFILEPGDKAPIGPVLPGQYVTVSTGESPARQRSYSVSRRADGKSLRISVRRVGAGGTSDELHDTVDVGTELLVGVPAGRFVLASAAMRTIALISAGVGITPLLPMLDELAQENSDREIWFIHAARDAAHHLFEEEARAIAARVTNGSVRLVSCYSRPEAGDRSDFVGRLDSGLIAGLLRPDETDFYICGPNDFMTSLRDGLVECGADEASIHFEAFEASAGPTSTLPSTLGLAECTVTFERSGRSIRWSPSDGTLLDLALKHDINVAYSCRLGDCESCIQKVTSGVVHHHGDETPLLNLNQTLLCLAVPCGDLVLDC